MNNHPPYSRILPVCPGYGWSRREFLKSMVASAAMLPAVSPVLAAPRESPPVPPPRALSTIGLCKRYDYAEVRRVLSVMLEELGDVCALAKNHYVTVKLNLVNTSEEDLGGLPVWLTVTVHPHVAMALGSLLVDYGAKQVTFCDQLPFRELGAEAFRGYGYRIEEFSQAMDGKVRFVNTRNRGEYDSYALVKVPDGGEIASCWEVNQTYIKTDVLVSLGKLKSHVSAGITGGMKNLYGVPPSSLYGDDAGDEPNEDAMEYRSGTMHTCTKKPLTSVESFTGKTVENDHGFNVPRLIVDLNAAFPIQLVVIDGISSIQSAEGWWIGSLVSVCRPGVLIAGRNPVCTDAVATAVMGFDPDAPDRHPPFANGDNHLAMARRKGLGENRISALEIAGVGLEKARFEYVPTYQRVNPSS
ncbi:MAG TPA: DUF362 domain-containing protein [bacterium]|nr:DUF362 domain-containing protein [Candidatus Omnitrophota bacterium]HOJ60154.1 DUF362 domain-containing protein [bacterium]HPO98968.1 DUF362 domain-containing protein [bacterium]